MMYHTNIALIVKDFINFLQGSAELYYLKGAPERVLKQCKYWGATVAEKEIEEADLERVSQRAKELGSRGLRGKVLFHIFLYG